MRVTRNAGQDPAFFLCVDPECCLEILVHLMLSLGSRCPNLRQREPGVLTMMRVHSCLLVLSVVAFLQGCTTMQPPALQPLSVHPADAPISTPSKSPASKIVRFADTLGAVASSDDSSKLQSMLVAFDYCDREQRLAFVTPPMAYSPRINYSRVSTYSLRFTEEASSSGPETRPGSLALRSYVAPFECIDQKHSVKTGLAESEDVPANVLHGTLNDHKGGVIVHRTLPGSAFRENDILITVGAFRVQTRGEMAKAVDVSPPGEISFGVVRDSKLIHFSSTVIDTTSKTRENALHLLEALCKETGATGSAFGRSCASHAFLAANL
jgi:hypothetical protein